MAAALRVGSWVAGNALALWIVDSVICNRSPEVAASLFGVVIGTGQAPAIARSWREFVAWATLTGVVLPAAGVAAAALAVMLLYGSGSAWPIILIVAAAVGVAVGVAQSAIFYMRGTGANRLRLWPLAVALSAAITTALHTAIGGPIGPCGPQDAVALVTGAVFAALTAAPLMLLMRDSQART